MSRRPLRLDTGVATGSVRITKNGSPTELEVDGVGGDGPSGFIEAALAEARLLARRFAEGREGADLDRATASLAEARRRAPGDPRPVFAEFDVALMGEHLEQAEAALTAITACCAGEPRSAPGAPSRAPRQGPGGTRADAPGGPAGAVLGSSVPLGQPRVPAGRNRGGRARLEDLLRRFPQDLAAHSKLAQIELASGDPARARDLYAELVAKNPEFPELSNLGLANMLLGDLAAAERDLRHAAELEPKNPGALLNLADAVELQGRRDEAQRLYRRTLELAENDPAAAHWQIRTIRAQALAHLGRAEEAVATIQTVLAQEDSQASFEAAVVFALVGDLASAKVNAARPALPLDGRDLTGVKSRCTMTPMVKTQVYLPEEELSGLHDLARGTGKSVAELIRQAIRQTWFTTNARGPVALWKGEVRTQSVDHDVIYDDP